MTLAIILVLALAVRAPARQSVGTTDAGVQRDRMDTPAEPGWIELFDGISWKGWRPPQGANWRIVDGAITVSEGRPGILCTTSQWSDFELMVEFQIADGTNSGVFVRTSPDPADPVTDCYEINLIRSGRHPFGAGAIVGRVATGIPNSADADGWHRLHVLAQGSRLETWIDGERAAEYDDPNPLGRGYIGLQFNGGPAAFRRIYLRPLGLQSLLPETRAPGSETGGEGNGPAVDGLAEFWLLTRIGPANARWSPDGPRLELRGGPGCLESRGSWSDFVLQCCGRTVAPATNSGIFFRCVPGSMMDGYEIQIDHSVADEGSSRPANAGTGAIFRQTEVAAQRAKDGEWFTMTAAVCGPRISVWVDGRIVTDWVDQRAANENPRRGRRLEAGPLMLQGHDPGTAIDFRSIDIAELRERRGGKTE